MLDDLPLLEPEHVEEDGATAERTRKSIPVAVAAPRAPEALASQAEAIGPTVTSATSGAALRVDGGVVRFVA